MHPGPRVTPPLLNAAVGAKLSSEVYLLKPQSLEVSAVLRARVDKENMAKPEEWEFSLLRGGSIVEVGTGPWTLLAFGSLRVLG